MPAEQNQIEALLIRALIDLLETIAKSDHHFSQLSQLPVPLISGLVEHSRRFYFQLILILDLEFGVGPVVTGIAHRTEIGSSWFDVDLAERFPIPQRLGGPHAKTSHKEQLFGF